MSSLNLLHDRAAAVLLLGRLVEHLALRTQSVGLCDKSIYLLATLQYGFDGLVQNNLGLVKLLLDLWFTVLASHPSPWITFPFHTFMMLSACCGSWYLVMYSFNCGNGTPALLVAHALRGFLLRNSSRTLLNS